MVFCPQCPLGVRNHAIVMPDASDATLDALVTAGFGTAGQRSMALNTVIFVGGSGSWYEIFETYVSLCYMKFVKRYMFLMQQIM